ARIKLSKQKQPSHSQVEFESEKRSKQKDTKTGINNHTPTNGKTRGMAKQQTKTTKHTIEFSNNTPH
ncbi:hypothetical protein, partial [Mycolicibacterium grossiae]|uniref:hypothetical protein n=1 Tax=Mycolicibacterium grossiae TaxID=1552759 RepID=UPI001C406414